MVIRGSQPVIVDTGCELVADHWFDQVFSVVEPDDVRWIFLSHDDHDHVGNLPAVLDACPNATLVANAFMTGRLAGSIPLPLDRMRWVDTGASFDAGDRTLCAVRPPLFDSPTTRGLFDPSTGVLWAVDSFGCPLPGEVYEAADMDPELYDLGSMVLNPWNSPWVEWVDRDRFARHLADSSSLAPTALVSAHGPIIRGRRAIDHAYDRVLDMVGAPLFPQPGQADLDALVTQVFAMPDPVAA